MNSIVISGVLACDGQLRHTQDQKSVAETTVEFEDGQLVKITAWGKASELLGTLKQGQRILVDGRIEIVESERPEGFKEKLAQITASRIQVLDGSFPVQVNVVNLAGRAGRDTEVKYFESGKSVSKVSIAVDNGRRDSTSWWNIEGWDKTAEVMANYVRKGSLVGVTGRLKLEKWQDRNSGADRTSPALAIDQLRLLGSRSDNQQHQSGSYNPEPQQARQMSKQQAMASAKNLQPASDVDLTDIPF